MYVSETVVVSMHSEVVTLKEAKSKDETRHVIWKYGIQDKHTYLVVNAYVVHNISIQIWLKVNFIVLFS